MSGLKNTIKRSWNAGRLRGWQTTHERKEKNRAKQRAVKDAIYSDVEIPDAEAIKRNERRKSAKRQGSRANTVLTYANQDAPLR